MLQKLSNFQKNTHPFVIFFLILVVVFISRLPFLNAGYGNDWDSWKLAFAARRIATTGNYEASRLPGFPVPEMTYSLIWDKGFFLFNAITAMLSAVGVGFFWLILYKLKSKDAVIASIALAFIPVIYINSTVTIDYVWALAFILISMYFAQQSKGVVSGLFLGLAIGSRITSVLMIIPLGIILAGSTDKTDRLNRLARFSLSACLIGVVSYVPVILTYGAGFLTYYSSGYPPLFGVLRVFTFDAWGGLGLVAGGCAATFLIVQLFQSKIVTTSLTTSKRETLTWLVAIIFYLVIFFLLPHEAGYLIPTLPFVIMLIARLLRRSYFITFCVILLFSPFFFSVSSMNWIEISGIASFSNHAIYIDIPGNQVVIDPLYGPLISDYRQRVNGVLYTRKVLSAAEQLDPKSVVVTGTWLAKIQTLENDTESAKYIYLIENVSTAQGYLQDGFQIYYLPGQLVYNYNLYGIDLEDFGAMVLDVKN